MEPKKRIKEIVNGVASSHDYEISASLGHSDYADARADIEGGLKRINFSRYEFTIPKRQWSSEMQSGVIPSIKVEVMYRQRPLQIATIFMTHQNDGTIAGEPNSQSNGATYYYTSTKMSDFANEVATHDRLTQGGPVFSAKADRALGIDRTRGTEAGVAR